MFFFFNDTATTEIYTLSLHDALPILADTLLAAVDVDRVAAREAGERQVDRLRGLQDRKSTRLNSSHANISYAVFCLKKKKKDRIIFHFQLTHKNVINLSGTRNINMSS